MSSPISKTIKQTTTQQLSASSSSNCKSIKLSKSLSSSNPSPPSSFDYLYQAISLIETKNSETHHNLDSTAFLSPTSTSSSSSTSASSMHSPVALSSPSPPLLNKNVNDFGLSNLANESFVTQKHIQDVLFDDMDNKISHNNTFGLNGNQTLTNLFFQHQIKNSLFSYYPNIPQQFGKLSNISKSKKVKYDKKSKSSADLPSSFNTSSSTINSSRKRSNSNLNPYNLKSSRAKQRKEERKNASKLLNSSSLSTSFQIDQGQNHKPDTTISNIKVKNNNNKINCSELSKQNQMMMMMMMAPLVSDHTSSIIGNKESIKLTNHNEITSDDNCDVNMNTNHVLKANSSPKTMTPSRLEKAKQLARKQATPSPTKIIKNSSSSPSSLNKNQQNCYDHDEKRLVAQIKQNKIICNEFLTANPLQYNKSSQHQPPLNLFNNHNYELLTHIKNQFELNSSGNNRGISSNNLTIGSNNSSNNHLNDLLNSEGNSLLVSAANKLNFQNFYFPNTPSSTISPTSMSSSASSIASSVSNDYESHHFYKNNHNQLQQQNQSPLNWHHHEFLQSSTDNRSGSSPSLTLQALNSNPVTPSLSSPLTINTSNMTTNQNSFELISNMLPFYLANNSSMEPQKSKFNRLIISPQMHLPSVNKTTSTKANDNNTLLNNPLQNSNYDNKNEKINGKINNVFNCAQFYQEVPIISKTNAFNQFNFPNYHKQTTTRFQQPFIASPTNQFQQQKTTEQGQTYEANYIQNLTNLIYSISTFQQQEPTYQKNKQTQLKNLESLFMNTTDQRSQVIRQNDIESKEKKVIGDTDVLNKVEEHFRRSLGKKFLNTKLISKSSISESNVSKSLKSSLRFSISTSYENKYDITKAQEQDEDDSLELIQLKHHQKLDKSASCSSLNSLNKKQLKIRIINSAHDFQRADEISELNTKKSSGESISSLLPLNMVCDNLSPISADSTFSSILCSSTSSTQETCTKKNSATVMTATSTNKRKLFLYRHAKQQKQRSDSYTSLSSSSSTLFENSKTTHRAETKDDNLDIDLEQNSVDEDIILNNYNEATYDCDDAEGMLGNDDEDEYMQADENKEEQPKEPNLDNSNDQNDYVNDASEEDEEENDNELTNCENISASAEEADDEGEHMIYNQASRNRKICKKFISNAICANNVETNIAIDIQKVVDTHFLKALGEETWKKLKLKPSSTSSCNASPSESSTGSPDFVREHYKELSLATSV